MQEHFSLWLSTYADACWRSGLTASAIVFFIFVLVRTGWVFSTATQEDLRTLFAVSATSLILFMFAVIMPLLIYSFREIWIHKSPASSGFLFAVAIMVGALASIVERKGGERLVWVLVFLTLAIVVVARKTLRNMREPLTTVGLRGDSAEEEELRRAEQHPLNNTASVSSIKRLEAKLGKWNAKALESLLLKRSGAIGGELQEVVEEELGAVTNDFKIWTSVCRTALTSLLSFNILLAIIDKNVTQSAFRVLWALSIIVPLAGALRMEVVQRRYERYLAALLASLANTKT